MKKLISVTMLLILCLFIGFTNQTKYIHVTILDMNDSFRTAMNLYVKRFNKYGGIDNHLLKIDESDNTQSIATIEINPTNIKIGEESFKIDKSLGFNHLNYRMSATINDSKRQKKPLPTQSIINNLKALDLIVECLPTTINTVADTQKVVIEKLKEHHYFKPNINSDLVVNVGIAMNKISNIDLQELTYNMDFFMWLKWDDTNTTINPADIEFINTLEPTYLLNPQDNFQSTVIDSSENSILYRINTKFKAIEFKNYVLGEQNLPIIFRHKTDNLKKIHYQFDTTSDSSNGLFSRNIITSVKDLEECKFNVIDNPNLKLHYTLNYSTFVTKLPMNDGNTSNIFSQFTFRYAIQATDTSLRGIENVLNSILTIFSDSQISINNMCIYIFVSLIISLFLTYARRNLLMHGVVTNIVWVLNFIVMMLMILCLEFLLSQILFDIKNSQYGIDNMDELHNAMGLLQTIVSLSWWLIPAYYFNSAINEFLWRQIESKTKQIVPKVLKMFISSIVYTLAFIGILAFVFEVTASSLMATSGIFAILFAVLSKVDISNIVAGLGISFSKTFKIGDWLKVNDEIGKVIEMTTRATKLRTLNNSIISIPNTIVGTAKIENYSNLNAIRQMIHLEVVPGDIDMIRGVLLDAVNMSIGVLHVPSPFIQFLGQGDSAQIFECYYFINDYANGAVISTNVWKSIWDNTKKANILMSTPQREHFLFKMQ